ncbi:DsbA family protein [Vibrio sp. FNV 38]|nr:DsbA family protein [Vibrio sp. FNV 38]
MSCTKLYYVYDPMCSWCWGYRPTWLTIESEIINQVEIRYLLGGLAQDTDQTMPHAMQQQIASYWKKIEGLLGTQFNYDFWQNNTPRRATYPACRAVLVARKHGLEKQMLYAIQQAYYLQARNPSDNEILVELAQGLGLDNKTFSQQLTAAVTQDELVQEINFARSIGGNSFPSLFVESHGQIQEIPIDYQNPSVTVNVIKSLL